jgi:mono/diheme cytochrome c family protein
VRARWIAALAVLLTVLAVAVATRGMGLTARRAPWPGEARLAQFVRSWTVPAEYRRMSNPVAPTAEALRAGMEHWADHCALCHGNDGSGQLSVGRSLFPAAPDMREGATQRLSDGALFYAIEQGVPFTGMPAWSSGTAAVERESWELVLFIRHLPRITREELDEMETLNPKSAGDIERERRIEDFLRGGE